MDRFCYIKRIRPTTTSGKKWHATLLSAGTLHSKIELIEVQTDNYSYRDEHPTP
ncbi:hypothetical protein SEVIR_9G482150v4 [Setaria viridis]